MLDHGAPQVNRRGFLQSGAAATALTLATAAPGLGAPEAARDFVLPRRRLGNTGVDVTILNQGTWRSPDSLDRLLRLGHASGIRYIDTAHSYGSEPGVAKFLETLPAGKRKEIFLVTKEGVNSPSQLIKALDERLATLKTDYVDLFFIHGIGGKAKLDWPKSKELKDTIAAIKKSGKAKFVGFSCHDALKVEFLEAAAVGKLVDAIMIAYSAPWTQEGARLNKALDACHKAGIGLISMKQISGTGDKFIKEVPNHFPDLAERGLTPYQLLLHSIWTDERISSCCVSMRNTDQLRENVAAAKTFVPMKRADLDRLRDALLASGPTMCANCDGSCSRAAGTEAALGDLARLYTYHEEQGLRADAREQYAALSLEHRDWTGADLEAARQACPSRLNFAAILPAVTRRLA